jgi:hypothetical protein
MSFRVYLRWHAVSTLDQLIRRVVKFMGQVRQHERYLISCYFPKNLSHCFLDVDYEIQDPIIEIGVKNIVFVGKLPEDETFVSKAGIIPRSAIRDIFGLESMLTVKCRLTTEENIKQCNQAFLAAMEKDEMEMEHIKNKFAAQKVLEKCCIIT